MSKKPQRPSTTYTIVPQKDGSFNVRIDDGAYPTSVYPFLTEAEAEAWIVGERKRAPDLNQRAKSIVDRVTRGD